MNGKIRIGFVYMDIGDRAGRAGKARRAGQMVPLLESSLVEGTVIGLTEKPGWGKRALPPVDVLFPVADSPQERLRLCAWAAAAGLGFAGPGLAHAALAGDYILGRRLLAGGGIDQPLFRSFSRWDWQQRRQYCLIEMELTLGYPCRITSGTLVQGEPGAVVHTREELEQAVDAALDASTRILAEEVVTGQMYAAALLPGEVGDRRFAVLKMGPQETGGLAVASEWVDRSAAGAPKAADEPEEAELPEGADKAEMTERVQIAGVPQKGNQAETAGLAVTADRSTREEAPEVDWEASVIRAAGEASQALEVTGPSIFYLMAVDDGKRLLLMEADLHPSLEPDGLYTLLWSRTGQRWGAMAEQLARRGRLRGASEEGLFLP